MALSDFVRSVLQNIQYAGTAVAPLMGNNWQQAAQEMQNRQMQQQQADAQAAQQQQANDFETQRLAQSKQYQDAEVEDRRQQILQGFSKLGKVTLAEDQSPGGAGLQSGGASLGAGGGAMQPNQPNVPPQIPTTLGILNGMQGAPSQTPNAANQSENAGLAQQRFAGAPTASQGGVVIPAASGTPASNVVPTAFQFIGPGGKKYNYTPGSDQSDDPNISVPAELQGLANGAKTLPLSQFRTLSEAAKSLGIQVSGAKATKEPNPWSSALDTAIKEKYPKANSLDDPQIPITERAGIQNRATEIQAGEAGAAAKEARQAALDQRAKDVQDAHDSDNAVMNLVKRDGQAIFDIKDEKQLHRIQAQADAQGIKLPTRQIPKQGQMADSDLAADSVQQTISRMSQIAKLLGPADFGAVGGRLLNAEGEWGSPVFAKDDMRSALEQEFRTLSVGLTAQETKLVGGGRASVQLFNAMKEITPSMKMDAGSFLQGAMRGTIARAQMTKTAIKHWSMGEIENPYKEFSPNKSGSIVTLKDGRKVKLTSDPDEKGNFSYVPAQ